jgi:hypothetical protein
MHQGAADPIMLVSLLEAKEVSALNPCYTVCQALRDVRRGR